MDIAWSYPIGQERSNIASCTLDGKIFIWNIKINEIRVDNIL